MGWLKNQWEQMRGNIKWDISKAIGAFVLVPFLPGVRGLPRRIPVYKLIWRDHYRSLPLP